MNMPFFMIIAEGFLLGLSTGVFCFINCVPVLLPFLFAEEAMDGRKNLLYLFLFILGRLIGYTAVGISLGFAGYYANEFIDPVLKRNIASLAYILLGALLLFSVLKDKILPRKKVCRRMKLLPGNELSVFLFGILTAFSFCPPFLMAIARAVNTGSILSGILYFLSFFISTSLFLVPFSSIFFIKRFFPLRKSIAKTTTILLGLYFMIFIGFANILL